MTYYGPSPFYWSWKNKTDKTSTAGDFYFSSPLAKKYSIFYLNTKLENDDDCFYMIYENVTMVIISIKEKSRINNLMLSGHILPVMGTDVAFSTSLQTSLKSHVQKHNTGVALSGILSKRNSKMQNERIISFWLKEPLDNSLDKKKVLCFFHDDHNPSAVYFLNSGMFKCFVCNKKCFNLFKNLKLIAHPILNELKN